MHPHRLGATLLVTTLASAPAGAVTVYRCVENGSIAYRQNASDPSCQALDFPSEEPSAESVASQRKALEQNPERRPKARENRRQRMAAQRNSGQAANSAEQDSSSAVPPIPRELDFEESPR